MLVSSAISNIRKRISDEDAFGYQDDELVNYINDSIALIWMQLIEIGSPETIKRASGNDTTLNKPTDFYKLIGNPTLIDNGATFTNYGKPAIDYCYFANSPVITITDTLPFTNGAFHSLIMQLSAILALNRNEFDISQDKMLADEIRKLIK